MITYAERACFRPAHLRTLDRARALVDRVADTWGDELRCHELARAGLRALGDDTLVVVDGHCGIVEHSWLRFSDGAILDAYAPGRLPAVQIVDAVVSAAYRPEQRRRRDVRRTVVDKLVLEMRGASCASRVCGARDDACAATQAICLPLQHAARAARVARKS